MVIIAVQGGKGGILKTGTAELISAWLDANSISWQGADTDQVNKTFNAVHGSDNRVKKFDLYDTTAGRLNIDQVNALVNDIDRARQDNVVVYLIDQGAGQENVLRGALAETGLLEEIREGKIRLTIAHVTVNTDAALTTLITNLQTSFADVPAVEWIIVANEFKGRFDGPSGNVFALNDALAQAIADRRARFVTVPLVPDEARPLTVFENSGKNLTEFVIGGPYAERGRLRTWMLAVHADLNKVADVLCERGDVPPVPASAPRSSARTTGSKARSHTGARTETATVEAVPVES